MRLLRIGVARIGHRLVYGTGTILDGVVPLTGIAVLGACPATHHRGMQADPLPQYCPSPRELDDLELLCQGALKPLAGFEGAGGAVTLRVPSEIGMRATAAGTLELTDPEGAAVATVTVESTYPAGELTGIAGPVHPTGDRTFGPLRRFYDSPASVASRHGPETVTVPVTAPLTTLDLKSIAECAGENPVLLLALAGSGCSPGLPPTALIRATMAAAALLGRAEVVVAPLASRRDPVSQRAVRGRVVQAYAPGTVLEVTGDGELPDEVAAIMLAARPPRDRQGLVVFFTGLSGSGKSTLARALEDTLLEDGRRSVTSLDGDVVRRHLSDGLGFSREDRDRNVRRIGWVAAEISRHGGVAICSPIAPFDGARQWVRAMVEEAGGAFVLVHVATPLTECERRDRKGLYARARRGDVADFTGISSPYEEPADASVVVDTSGRSVTSALDDVLAELNRQGRLPRPVS